MYHRSSTLSHVASVHYFLVSLLLKCFQICAYIYESMYYFIVINSPGYYNTEKYHICSIKDILFRWKSPALPEPLYYQNSRNSPLPADCQHSLRSPQAAPTASPCHHIQSTTTTGASCFTRGHNGSQNLRGHAGLKNSRGSVLLNQRTHLIPKPQNTQARRKEKKEKRGSKYIINKDKLRN